MRKSCPHLEGRQAYTEKSRSQMHTCTHIEVGAGGKEREKDREREDVPRLFEFLASSVLLLGFIIQHIPFFFFRL